MAKSKYHNLPAQVYTVYRFTDKLSRWQRQYKVPRAKGVWAIHMTVVARSPWEACAIVRRKSRRWTKGYRLRAMPHWQKAQMEE